MKFRYSVPCCKSRLKEVRNFVKRRLKPLPFKQEASHLIVLAVDEACANAIIHGNDCDDGKTLQIDFEVEGERLAVEIYDVGKEYPRKAPDGSIDWQQSIEKGNKGGIGLHIMKQIMDEVKFYHRDNLHICHLSKSWS